MKKGKQFSEYEIAILRQGLYDMEEFYYYATVKTDSQAIAIGKAFMLRYADIQGYLYVMKDNEVIYKIEPKMALDDEDQYEVDCYSCGDGGCIHCRPSWFI